MRRGPQSCNVPQPSTQRSISRVIQLIEGVKCDELSFKNEITLERENAPLVNPLSQRFSTSAVEAPVRKQITSFTKAAVENVRLYSVLWGKPNTRKHKTWEGDGKLEISATCWRLTDESGTTLGTARATAAEPVLESGFRLRIGNKEVEIVDELQTGAHLPNSSIIQPASKKPKLSCNENSQRFPKEGLSGKPLIFPRPADEHQWSQNARKCSVRDVVLDSLLGRSLRPHQKEGLVFLYECVMGYKNPRYHGAILADEMGLGKTLQTVALIWTLLKQGPYGTAVCKKVMVVTPSSLCANWSKEFTKWLGSERIKTYVVDKSHKASHFSEQPLVPVMIISYEQFVRSFADVIKYKFDMVVCDEGHRLKNASVKAAQLVGQLKCRRRVLLTGTPVQNHLQEYFSLIELVNPGILGSSADFRTNYEAPIVAAQQPQCSDSTKLLAQEKSAELNKIISKFILRRTQDVMENYLPSKVELIVCCSLSPVQRSLYESIIDEWFTSKVKNPFAVIAILKKICNHPSLVSEYNDNHSELVENSGKLRVIDSLLKNIVIDKNENIVLVSYSTKFLDILQKLCTLRQLKYLRLDGTTPVVQRKSLVESFNAHLAKIFLVSARAGGTGLNLTGASRLVLADGDWNPSNDLQALARIWRDGQKKGVTIYRLMCTGTIEEKIFQRQLSKLALGDSVDHPENVKFTLKFSEEELKDLFTPNLNTDSITHQIIECPCRRDPDYITMQSVNIESNEVNEESQGVNQLKAWNHFGKPFPAEFLEDVGLRDNDVPTFIFQKITNQNML